MNALFAAAKEISNFMRQQGWEFCIIGGLAVQRWGEPRTTLDVDIDLLADWGEEEKYITVILDKFESRISDGKQFALANRVLLVTASNGKDIDISLGALPFEVAMVSRAVQVALGPEIVVPCCTAEDLFIMKAFAGRPRDWLDAESIVTRQQNLDVDHITRNLADLCELKQSPDILERAKRLLEERP